MTTAAEELRSKRRSAGESGTFRLTGVSAVARSSERILEAVARRDCSVLLSGESGTGKEVAARHIHALSPRAAGPFVAVDCTTLTEHLFESQLFGHQRGAFTGADRDTLGFFRAADGGTLFLDEIGELAPALQAKLLRCVQDRAVVPLGAVKPVPLNVRVLAATNRDLKGMVEGGKFREDLYYRINVVNLHLPPLRQRLEDILPLAQHLMERIADLYDEAPKSFADETAAALLAYGWRGNIRELANAVEHAFVMCNELVLKPEHLPEYIVHAVEKRAHRGQPGTPLPTLDEALRTIVSEALKDARGNQAKAARTLGVHRQRLYRLVTRFGLQTAAEEA